MLAFLIAAAITSFVDPKAQAILDAAKVAAGGAAVDRLGAYELDERVATYGLHGTATLLCDPQTGAYAVRRALGPASNGEGFDGLHVWAEDATGDDEKTIALRPAIRLAPSISRYDDGCTKL